MKENKEGAKRVFCSGEGASRLAPKLFCIGFFALCAYLILKYAMGAILPFGVAYAVSLVIRPIARATSKRTHIPEKLCAAVYVTVVIGALAYAIFWSAQRLIGELHDLVERASDGDLFEYMSGVRRSLLGILDKLGLSGDGDGAFKMGELTKSAMTKLFESVGSLLAGVVTKIVTHTPSLLIGASVTLIACYYLSMGGMNGLIPTARGTVLFRVSTVARDALKRYARAYLLLMLLTFFEVLIGLLILKKDYAFLISLGIAAVDLLPLLGAGSVLLPWAIVSFIMRDTQTAMGLLILYGIIVVVRQIAEPRIVGSSIGISPIASLFSMYVGLKLFGLIGMILGPAAAFVISELVGNESGDEAPKNNI